jgi:hypothetical protein
MSDVQCALCVWLSELPVPLQILFGLLFLTVLAPALFWLLAAVTPGIDRMFERYLTGPPNRYEHQQVPPAEDSSEKSVAGATGKTARFYIVSNTSPGASDAEH